MKVATSHCWLARKHNKNQFPHHYIRKVFPGLTSHGLGSVATGQGVMVLKQRRDVQADQSGGCRVSGWAGVTLAVLSFLSPWNPAKFTLNANRVSFFLFLLGKYLLKVNYHREQEILV